ncbi:hypothetical protein R1T16_01790 [Flavobacterium sp. DG1-102-2]|uniref:hypothetical protein n=1 Tax=Flavobacterium sp. DG1-102-2 TaxID=3081663 RepID=UPI002948E540|nr:hypothetical protein [Flavobacterium sp. DG1-102-2]MDV6167137.1 hypothetical protein [Flavobacterium sp. DG1-102-2]
MKPVSAWTAAAQIKLESGTLILEKEISEYTIKIIFDDYDLWFVVQWNNNGGRVAFRAAQAAGSELTLKELKEHNDEIIFLLQSAAMQISVVLSFPTAEKTIFRYTTTITPAFDTILPYWPRDIMPLFKAGGKTQNTAGTVHASQMGNRSGLLYFSLEKPKTGSVFYFQNLTALNKFFQDTQTSGADLVGGLWPELGLKLPSTEDKPLKKGEDYIISDAFVLLSDSIVGDNYDMAQRFIEYLAAIYLLLPKPQTLYQDWPEIVDKGLKDLFSHQGCWKFADGRSYLNAYVSDYKTPPESMVQLAVLLPLMDFDRWSGESHKDIIETIHNGLENFYDKELGTVVRWLPALEKNLDWSEEQKQPEVMDSWYLHHPLLNLSRLALNGDALAKKLVLDSIDYVIKVAHHFKYEWPVFYKMATLEVLKEETAEGQGGEKDVPGAYSHLMIQVWQLTGEEKYFKEAIKAARKMDGLGFDIFYQANNTAFSAGALLRLYKETGDKLYLNLSYMLIAAVLKNVQLWECDYGNARHYPTFFAIYPLKDAPYTAAYEEQEVFAAMHSFLREADGVQELLPGVRLLLAECVKYVINRVSYYYPPRLPKEVIAEQKDVKTGEIDPNLWIALEDLQDGWQRSGQVGQEVYGAGIAFGIVPRQYFKIEKAGLMIFTEYPATDFKVGRSAVTFFTRGDQRLSFRMVVVPLAKGNDLPAIAVTAAKQDLNNEIKPVKSQKQFSEYTLLGNSTIKVSWKA